MSTLDAVPVTSVAQSSEVQARHEAAQARATWRAANAIGAANEDKAAKAAATISPSDALGSLAVATTVAALMSSTPAAFHLMTHSVLSPGREKPDNAVHSISQFGDAQVPRRVASPAGSTGTGMQAGSSSTGQRGDRSAREAFAGKAGGTAPAQTAAGMAQFSGTGPLPAVIANANANPAAVAARTRGAGGSGAQAMQASPSTLSGAGVRQAIAQFKQNATSIRIPMSVVAIVA